VQEDNKIVFEPGSVEITEAAGEILDRIAEILPDCLHVPMEIGGHTDSQGREEMNLGLSQSRADAVLNGLLARGVLVSNLTARGYGETRPIADNDTEEGRERNRRIEFRLQDEVDARDAAEAEAEAEAARLPKPSAFARSKTRRFGRARRHRRTTQTRSNRRMDRLQFIIAIAVILFVAFGLGWLAHWLVARFSRVSSADLGEMEALARALHDAEETRDQAIAYLQSRETELTGQLSQTEAELRAAMEGLREARAENEELRSYIEQLDPAAGVTTSATARPRPRTGRDPCRAICRDLLLPERRAGLQVIHQEFRRGEGVGPVARRGGDHHDRIAGASRP
jgi:hypothetical protein